MPAHGHGDVVVADHLAGRGVEAFPTGAGQVNFRPGVGCALALRERGRVQVAADKARRQTQGTAGLDEQGRKIAAGTGAAGQSGRRCLNARFLALLIGESGRDRFIDPFQQKIGFHYLAGLPELLQPRTQHRSVLVKDR